MATIVNSEKCTESTDGKDISWTAAATAGNMVLVFLCNTPTTAPAGWVQVAQNSPPGGYGHGPAGIIELASAAGGETSVTVDGIGFSGAHETYKVEINGADATVAVGAWTYTTAWDTVPIVTAPVTPATGSPAFVFGLYIKIEPNAGHYWTGSSGTILQQDGSVAGMQGMIMYEAIADPSGSYATSATFTYDQPHWQSVAIAVSVASVVCDSPVMFD